MTQIDIKPAMLHTDALVFECINNVLKHVPLPYDITLWPMLRSMNRIRAMIRYNTKGMVLRYDATANQYE